MKRTDEQEEHEGFVRGYHDIPSDNELCKMSFVELASLLASSEKDSPKFIAIERELKKHLAKDQAKINLPNMLWAACVGGVFALAGVFIGAQLKSSPAPEQIAPSATVQQADKSKLTENPPRGDVAPDAPAIGKPATHPAPVQNNTQPSK